MLKTYETEIQTLLTHYTFPLAVVEDVNKRLADCQTPAYVAQQVRYLQQYVQAGIAIPKFKESANGQIRLL